MRKNILIILYLVVSILLVSCQKDNYCAECVESNTGTTSDYCGTESQVDRYIKTLKNMGSSFNQDWDCEKVED